jgi:hypothetical protein
MAVGRESLGYPTISDRVAQTVVARRLELKVEPIFHPGSYGYRPYRSALDAVAVCRERCWKTDWVFDKPYETHSVVEFVPADTGQRWLVEVGSWTDPAEESETAVDAPRAVRATAGQPTAIASAPVVDLALWAWT